MLKWKTVVGGKEYAFAFLTWEKSISPSLYKLFLKTNLLLLKLGRDTYMY